MRLGRKQGWEAMLRSLARVLWLMPGSGCFEVGSVIVQPVYCVLCTVYWMPVWRPIWRRDVGVALAWVSRKVDQDCL